MQILFACLWPAVSSCKSVRDKCCFILQWPCPLTSSTLTGPLLMKPQAISNKHTVDKKKKKERNTHPAVTHFSLFSTALALPPCAFIHL